MAYQVLPRLKIQRKPHWSKLLMKKGKIYF